MDAWCVNGKGVACLEPPSAPEIGGEPLQVTVDEGRDEGEKLKKVAG